MNAMDTEGDKILKKQIVLGILAPNSQTGMTPTQIFDEYIEREGKRLMTTAKEARDFLEWLVDSGDITVANGRYYNNSAKSGHVVKMVLGEDQNKNARKFGNNSYNGATRGRYPNHNNQSFARSATINRRKSVCYEDPYITVNRPPQPFRAAGITRRRMTMGTYSRPITPPRSRSRSNSPNKVDTFGRIQKKYEKRSNSPDSRSKRSRERSPGSPAAKRSCRSRSSSRERKSSHRRGPTSPSRDPRRPRSRSPNQHQQSHSSSRERTGTNFKADASRDTQSPAVRPVQAVTPHDASHRAIIDRRGAAVAGPSTITKNVRHFKFNIVGDGFMYYVIRKLDETITLNPYLIAHDLRMETAIESVSEIMKAKTQKKKSVILSVGTANLRNGTSLIEMRKLFVTLYKLCEKNGLKPLVATIHCMDTPELNDRANVFNTFLKNNFDNVLDLFEAHNGGLAQSLANFSKNATLKPQNPMLSIGMHSRLVLKVEL